MHCTSSTGQQSEENLQRQPLFYWAGIPLFTFDNYFHSILLKDSLQLHIKEYWDQLFPCKFPFPLHVYEGLWSTVVLPCCIFLYVVIHYNCTVVFYCTVYLFTLQEWPKRIEQFLPSTPGQYISGEICEGWSNIPLAFGPVTVLHSTLLKFSPWSWTVWYCNVVNFSAPHSTVIAQCFPLLAEHSLWPGWGIPARRHLGFLHQRVHTITLSPPNYPTCRFT